LQRAVIRLTGGPARVVGVPKGTLEIGADADVTLIDPETAWMVDSEEFRSKGRNTPFAGWPLKGRVVRTLVGGRTVFAREAVGE
jgi:dihydroorotase